MERYSEYKDSGVEWLGEIPRHWELRKMKFSFEERSQKGFPTLPLLAATQNHGVIRKSDYENRTVEATKSLDTLKLVEVGDFVISLRSFQGGIELCHDRGIISPAYTILKPSHIKSCYFKYLGKSPVYLQLLKSMVTGIREGQNIDYGKLRENLIPIPTEAEQEAIANYLDKVTSKIDAAIAQQQKMIELLNERKQIIINNAVTKGLDPTAKMKPSGIPWLGNIPAHWEVRRLKSLMSMQRGHDLTAEKFKIGNVPVYGSGGLMGYHNQVTSNSPNIVIGRSGSVGRLHYIEEDFWAHNTVIYLTDSKGNDVKYIYYLLSSLDLSSLATQTAVPTLDRKKVLNKTVATTMNISEQMRIAEQLDKLVESINVVIANKNEEISLLQERKQIIINDIVTGKVKVS